MMETNISSEKDFFSDDSVKELETDTSHKQNEILKRFIYIGHKSNISQFAKELGISRQYIWGIIAGRLQPSLSMARKICDALKVEDTRLIFPDGSIHYPDIVSASEYSADEIKEEHCPMKNQGNVIKNEGGENGS